MNTERPTKKTFDAPMPAQSGARTHQFIPHGFFIGPNVIFLFVCAVFVFSRAIYLDADAPRYVFAFYAPTDETYYTIPGFNLFHHGSWIFRPFDFLPPDEGPFTATQSFLTYISLSAFGNNFFGLRTPAVACALLTFVATLFVISRRHENWPHRTWLLIACTIFMLGDYFFQLSARYSDPTTFMMAFIATTMILVAVSRKLLQERPLVTAFLYGAAAGFGILFVYIYTIYVGAALAATIAIYHIRNARLLVLSAISFTLGLALLSVLFCLFIYVFFDQNPIDAIIAVFQIGRENAARGAIFKHSIFDLLSQNLITGLQQTIIHNLFAYNPALLLLFLVSLPIFIVATVRFGNSIDIFVSACLVFRLGLSIIIPFDYYEKKLIQVFPLIVYVVAVAAMHSSAIYKNTLRADSSWKILFLIYIAAAAFVVTRVPEWRIPKVYYQNELTSWLEFCIALAALILIVTFSLQKNRRLIAMAVLATVITIPGIRFTARFIYAEPTFLYRDALINAAPKLNGRVLAGGVAYPMRLYNSSIPIMNFYVYYRYGHDRFTQLSTYMFDNKLADGTVLFLPFHAAPIMTGLHQYVESGGLVLETVLDIKDVEEKYKFGLYLRPDLAKTN